MDKKQVFIIFAIVCLLAGGIVSRSAASAFSLNVGDIITFGTYEQDERGGADPIEWEVLAIEDGHALLISRYGLETKRYNEKFTGVTWETCTLRSWLNGQFFNKAFSAWEKSMIAQVRNHTEDTPYNDVYGGRDTIDRIFVLSREEAEMYLPKRSCPCEATYHARQSGAYEFGKTGKYWWWLRSPGSSSNAAMGVSAEGNVTTAGFSVAYFGAVVRPALWLIL